IEWSNSKMDMSWTIVEGETIHLILEYSTHLFKEETIGRMIDHYMSILQDIVEQPDKCLKDIELVSEKDRQQLLLQFNDTKKDYVKTKTLYTQ
ncbi:MAG: condensation domain-containing protein, partial [Bacillota bacterium]